MAYTAVWWRIPEEVPTEVNFCMVRAYNSKLYVVWIVQRHYIEHISIYNYWYISLAVRTTTEFYTELHV